MLEEGFSARGIITLVEGDIFFGGAGRTQIAFSESPLKSSFLLVRTEPAREEQGESIPF